MSGRSDIQAGKASVTLGFKDAEFIRGLRRSAERWKSFGSAVALTGRGIIDSGMSMVNKFVDAINVFTSKGSALADMSARLGISASALAEFGYSAEQTGSSLEGFEGGVRKMQKLLGDAANGSDSAKDTLSDLGLTLDQLRGKSPDQQFEVIAERIGAIEDPTARASMAMRAFGKSGTALLPMIESLAELRQQARDRGLVPTDDAVAAADRLGDSLDALIKIADATKFEIGSALAPEIEGAVNVFVEVVKASRAWISENKSLVVTIAAISAGVVAAGAAVTGLGVAIFGAGVVLSGIATGLSTIASVAGVILSPVGLVVSALAAGAIYWIAFTDSGNRAVNRLISAVNGMFQAVKQVFGGILNAIRAGDFQLAGEIAITALRVALLRGTAAISKAVGGAFGDFIGSIGSKISGGDFAGAWDSAVKGMGAIWDTFCSGLINVFTEATKGIFDRWAALQSDISGSIIEDAAEGGFWGTAAMLGSGISAPRDYARKQKYNQTLLEHHKQKLISLEEDPNSSEFDIEDTKASIANLERRPSSVESAKFSARAQLTGTFDGLKIKLDEIALASKEQADNSKAKLGREHEGAAIAADAAANAGQAELDEKIRRAEAAAAAARNADNGRKAAAADALDGIGSGEDAKTKVFATFSAAALQVAGVQNRPMAVVEDQLRKANLLLVDQNLKLDKVVNALKDGVIT